MKIKQYTPPSLPPRIDAPRYYRLLVKAEHYLKECRSLLQELPSPKITYILKLRESFLSLYTQGMDIDMEKVCILKSKKDHSSVFVKRINNYLKALDYIEKVDEKVAFTIPFWEKLHSLVEKDFGKAKKEPGHIRKKQNWIGPKNCSMQEAFFLPPPPSDVPNLLQELLSYLKKPEPTLLQMGIGFSQFLGIHPFMDGNGRVARLFPAAFIKQRQHLNTPILFVSDYFLLHRLDYLKNLHYLTMERNWDKWLLFYCRALEEESYNLSLRLKKLLSLYKSLHLAFAEDFPIKERKRILLFIFEYPAFTLSLLQSKTKLSLSRCKLCVKILLEKKLVTKKRGSLVFTALLKACEKKRSPTLRAGLKK